MKNDWRIEKKINTKPTNRMLFLQSKTKWLGSKIQEKQ